VVQETIANYYCGAKKKTILGERLEIELECHIDMTEYPEHLTHTVKDQTAEGVWVSYHWLS
jgi:hypothetical protein